MLFKNEQDLRQRIAELTGRSTPGKVAVFEDTSAFMSIDSGDVLRFADNDYFVLGTASEGRFGIDDQPKYWVKIAVDLATGVKKIIKLVFDEAFDSRIGSAVFQCTRSPKKESAVLKAMRGHPNFMQGESVLDSAGNLVRIIDFIPGISLYERLRRLETPHETYYSLMLPTVMRSAMECMEGIRQLHEIGLNHGDIRTDHILVGGDESHYIWIDFDYDVFRQDYDVFCLGNVLLQIVGKGRHSAHDVALHHADYDDFKGRLAPGDMSLMYQHRVANLKKLFPHVSSDINDILMRFSAEATTQYQDVESILCDLRSVFSKGESGTSD
jgi:serine/threonine protein kinase